MIATLCRALPLAQIGSTGSIYFTMAMTIERYLTVCHPFYHHSHSWPTRCYILPILLFSIFYNVPRFFELETTFRDPEDNSTSISSINGSDFATATSNVSAEEEASNFTLGFSLQPTKFRLNYYYYTIYLVSFQILFQF